MIIHGREVHFLLTVGATKKVARLCPESDIQNVGLIFEGKSTEKMIDVIAELSEAMSEGYEENQQYIVPGYEPKPVTAKEIMTLTINDLSALQEELMKEIGIGMKTEIEAEPEKEGKLKKSVGETKSS